MSNVHVERGRLLLAQSRLKQAQEELQRGLALEPDDATAHMLLTCCLIDLGKHSDALAEARETIRIAPDWDLGHNVMARALDGMERLQEADAAVEEAIRLNPADADHFALRASIRAQQSAWRETLDWVQKGLACDPQHAECLRLQSLALTQMGRRRQAHETSAAALAHHPENAGLHAQRGWTYLHSGQARQALELFRQALQLEPGLEYARQGLVEALKARYLVYRLMLMYFLWSSRLGSKGRYFLFAGVYGGIQLMRLVSHEKPYLTKVLYPIVFIVYALILMTWLADPMFNLILKFNRFGRWALSRREHLEANVFAGLLISSILFVLLGCSGIVKSPAAWLMAGWSLAMLLPSSIALQMDGARKRIIFIIMVFVLGCIGLAAVVSVITQSHHHLLSKTLLVIFMLGWFGFSWLGSWGRKT